MQKIIDKKKSEVDPLDLVAIGIQKKLQAGRTSTQIKFKLPENDSSFT